MGALPKKKLSKSRTRNRRSKFVATIPFLTKCQNCGKLKMPHRVCSNCGYFGSHQILKVKGA